MFCCSSQCHSFEINKNTDISKIKLAVYSTFIITFSLIICRTIAYIITHSIAIEASIFDAVKDWLVSSLNALFILKSIKSANEKFPFGYGKVESLTAFLQSLFLFGTGCLIAVDLVHFTPHKVNYSLPACVVLVLSIVLASTLMFIQSHVSKKTQSLALKADAAHYKTDVAINVVVLIGFLLSTNLSWMDITIGCVIVVYLFITAYTIGLSAVNVLLDRSLDAGIVQQIKDIVTASGEKIFSLKTHSLGRGEFILIELAESKDNTNKQGSNTDLSLKDRLKNIEQLIHNKFEKSFVVVTVK
jgi:ferrous-iron efflux pump FieF